MASRSWENARSNTLMQVISYMGAHQNFHKNTAGSFRPPNLPTQGVNFSLFTLPNASDAPIAVQFREFFDFINNRVDMYRSELLPLVWPVLLRLLDDVLTRRRRAGDASARTALLTSSAGTTAESPHAAALALLDTYASLGLPLPPEFGSVRSEVERSRVDTAAAAQLFPPRVEVRVSQLAVDALNEFLSMRGATAILAALNDGITLNITAGLGAFPGRRPFTRPRAGRLCGLTCAPTTLTAHLAASDAPDGDTVMRAPRSELLASLLNDTANPSQTEAAVAALEGGDAAKAAASVSIVLETVYAPAAADVTAMALCVTSRDRSSASAAAAAAEGSISKLDSVLQHPTSAMLFCSTTDGVVRGWSLRNGGADGVCSDRTFCGHRGAIVCVDAELSGRWLISGGVDGAVNLFDTRTAASMAEYMGHGDRAVWAAQFCPMAPSRILSGGALRAGLLHDASSTTPVRVLAGHVADVTAVAWHPSNPRICATGCADRTVRIWDLSDARPVMQFGLLPDGVQSLAFSSCGTRLAMGSESGSLSVVNIVSDREVFQQRPPTVPTEFDTPVNCLSWAPGSDVVAAGYASPAVGVAMWSCVGGDDDAFVASYPTRATPVLACKYLASGLVQAAGAQAFISPA